MSWCQRTVVDYYSLGRLTKKEYLSVIETFRENKESNRKYRTSHPTTRQNSSVFVTKTLSMMTLSSLSWSDNQ